MYNILLVDDDTFFASVFKSGYDFAQRGFRVAWHAESGQKAIEILNGHSVDLAFVDMCMPAMNGAELIEYVSRQFPRVVCIGLSSHDDFDFVKGSFRHGALDYILKYQLNSGEMDRLLDAFLEKKGATGAQQHGTADGEDSALNEAMMLLLTGRQTMGGQLSLQALGLPEFTGDLIILRVKIQGYQDFLRRYEASGRLKNSLRAIRSMLQNILERHGSGAAFHNPQDGCFYCLLSDPRLASVQYCLYVKALLARQITTSLLRYFNLTAQCVASDYCRDVADIYDAFSALMIYVGEPPPAPPDSTAVEAIKDRLARQLPRKMALASEGELSRYIAARLGEGLASGGGPRQVQALAQAAMGVISACAQLAGAALEPLPGEPDGLENVLTERALAARAALGRLMVQGLSRHVLSAVQLIHERYGASALSLNTIAESLHISPSHLSRMFTSEMGVGIAKYIGRLRVLRAQDMLLDSPRTTKAVSQHCGFDSYTYFLRVFKDMTGLTPKRFVALPVSEDAPAALAQLKWMLPQSAPQNGTGRA